MSAIQLVNQVPAASAPSAEFHLDQGNDRIARIAIHAGGTASVPVTVVGKNEVELVTTAQQWTCYAIVNGITTPTVTTSDPNATIALRADNNEGFSLTVS